MRSRSTALVGSSAREGAGAGADEDAQANAKKIGSASIARRKQSPPFGSDLRGEEHDARHGVKERLGAVDRLLAANDHVGDAAGEVAAVHIARGDGHGRARRTEVARE